jgi:DTW domain-containing protein YfiP
MEEIPLTLRELEAGGVRNQKCPLCGTKLKKCKCGFLL